MKRDREVTSKVSDWFAARLPAQWSQEQAEIEVDRDEIIVVLPRPDDTATGDFREDTRTERIALARSAQETFARTVSWGVVGQGVRRLFTTVRAPVTALLSMPERRVLDSLTESGMAANRSDALAWCVRLVGQHEADWLCDLHDAAASADARAEQPTQF